MINILLLLIAVQFICGTDCPSPQEVRFLKAMSISFGKDYEKCPIITHAKFMASEVPGRWVTYPQKIQDLVLFMCLGETEQPRSTFLNAAPIGEIIAISKEKSDLVYTLKKEDKVKLIGTTFIGGGPGGNRVYFIASSIEKE